MEAQKTFFMSNRLFEPSRSSATCVRFPKELTSIFVDLYLCILEQKPKNIVDFSLQYFKTLKTLCDAKLTLSRDEDLKMDFVDPKILRRRNAVVDEEKTSVEPTVERSANNILEEESRSFKSTSGDRKKIKRALENHSIFKHLDKTSIKEIAQSFQPMIVKKGRFVALQGEDSSKCYFVDIGYFDEYVERPDGREALVGSFGQGTLFGESALFHIQTSPSFILSKQKSRLLFLERSTFKQILQRRNILDNIETINYTFDLFQNFTEKQFHRLISITVHKFYVDEILFKSHDISDGLFIVKSGFVEIYDYEEKTNTNMFTGEKANELKKVYLGVVKTGEYFGEQSLTTDCIRSVYARARGKVKVAFIDAKQFTNYFSNVEINIKKANILQVDVVKYK